MKTANDEKLSTIFIKELAQQMSLTSFLQTSAQIWPEKSNCIMNIWELFNISYLSNGSRFKYHWDHTLSMKEGGRRVFVGVMKYCRHILMGHEIFFKIFDGPQNIFLCSIFVILFFKLRELEHKISKLAIKEIS